MLLSNITRKTLNSQKRMEKEITLLKFRDIEPKRIVTMVTRNPNLLLASKENVQIFMLATISRSNAKHCSTEKGHHSNIKLKLKFKVVSSLDIRMYDSIYYSMYLNIVYQTQAPEIALIKRGYNIMTILQRYISSCPTACVYWFTGSVFENSSLFYLPKKYKPSIINSTMSKISARQ